MNEPPEPYYENHYLDKLGFLDYTANLLLDLHVKPEKGFKDQPILVATWSDPEIDTSYSLARFHPEANLNDASLLRQIELTVTARLPNGETSIVTHTWNPVFNQMSTTIQQMTSVERADFEERIAQAKAAMPKTQGPPNFLPPRRYTLSPEHNLELLISVLGRAFEILEQE